MTKASVLLPITSTGMMMPKQHSSYWRRKWNERNNLSWLLRGYGLQVDPATSTQNSQPKRHVKWTRTTTKQGIECTVYVWIVRRKRGLLFLMKVVCLHPVFSFSGSSLFVNLVYQSFSWCVSPSVSSLWGIVSPYFSGKKFPIDWAFGTKTTATTIEWETRDDGRERETTSL